MDDDTLRSLLEQACDPRTDSATRRNTQRLLAKKFPEELDKILTGKLHEVVEPQLHQAVTQPKPEVKIKVVEPKNYAALQRIAAEYVSKKIQVLQNGVEDYGRRFVLVAEVEGHLQTLGRTPESFGITQKMLDTWGRPPSPEPKGFIAKALYRAGKRIGTQEGGSRIDQRI